MRRITAGSSFVRAVQYNMNNRSLCNIISKSTLLRRQYSTRCTEQHDIVIVGGGLVGAALACGIGNCPMFKHQNVALVEPLPVKNEESLSSHPDLRVVAINQASVELLSEIGVWPSVTSKRATPYSAMNVWDCCGGTISFDANDSDGQPLGYIVENKVLLSALYEKLGNTKVKMYKTELESITPAQGDAWPEIRLKDGTTFAARVVVGADGGHSRVKSHVAPSTIGWSYPQRAVVATVSHPEGFHNDVAWQRFLPNGPIALLPLHANYSAIVWSTSIPHAEYLLTIDQQTFLQELNNAFRFPSKSVGSGFFDTAIENSPRVPEITGVLEHRGSFPLRSEHATKYVDNRLVLIGDAAHVVHPLAGQGLNLGLEDVNALLSVFKQANSVGTDLGTTVTLQDFENKRKTPNLFTVMSLDAIKNIFGSTSPILETGRRIGMSLLDRIPYAKSVLTKFARGNTVN